MQNKFLLGKQLADQAIAAGSLDAFFHGILFYTVQSMPDAETPDIEQTFFKFSSLILKERYHLFIDEYLQMPDTSLPEVSQTIIDEMHSIDLFFEKYYNLLKMRYVAADDANAGFFREYHRRDLKQDSMLRAFIITRNRIMNQFLSEASTGLAIAYLADGLTGTEGSKACLKSFLTLAGMRKYVTLGPQRRESILQSAAGVYEGVELPLQLLENLCVESLPAHEKSTLKMIEINKENLRSPTREYLSQFTWLLG